MRTWHLMGLMTALFLAITATVWTLPVHPTLVWVPIVLLPYFVVANWIVVARPFALPAPRTPGAPA